MVETPEPPNGGEPTTPAKQPAATQIQGAEGNRANVNSEGKLETTASVNGDEITLGTVTVENIEKGSVTITGTSEGEGEPKKAQVTNKHQLEVNCADILRQVRIFPFYQSFGHFLELPSGESEKEYELFNQYNFPIITTVILSISVTETLTDEYPVVIAKITEKNKGEEPTEEIGVYRVSPTSTVKGGVTNLVATADTTTYGSTDEGIILKIEGSNLTTSREASLFIAGYWVLSSGELPS